MSLHLTLRLGLGPASSSFSPLSFGSNLTAWWDANQGITVTGLGVSSWAPRAGAFTLTQGTDALRPPFSATGWDGSRPAVSGDGAATNGDILTATGPFASIQTVFVVAERGTQQDDPGSGLRTIYLTAQASGGVSAEMSVQRPTVDAGQTIFQASGNGSGNTGSTAPDGWGIGAKAVLVTQFATADIRARVGTGNAGGAGSFGATINTTTTVNLFGFSSVAARRFNGKIAEVVVVDRVVTDNERLAMVNHLVAKWGLL